MQLLTFAHKNEAAAFFHFHHFQPVANTHDLYSDGNHYLLITGEGLWDSLTKILLTLSHIEKQSQKISCLFNLGVAGSLRGIHKKFEAYQVRTAYAAMSLEKPEFHSYSAGQLSCENTYPLIDCLSFHGRVLTSAHKQLLAPFADIVDREAWAVGKAACAYQLPWYSLKVLSDELQEENICNLVQEQAHNFSQKLYHAWKSALPLSLKKESALDEFLEIFLPLLQTKQIYLTFSQRHQAQDFVQRILAQENISTSTLLSEIPFDLWKSKRIKENAQDLIQWLKLRLTPQFGHLATPVNQWIKIWHNSQYSFHMQTTDDFEALEVKFKSYNLTDWNHLLEHLQKIPREELERILMGKQLP